MRTILVAGLLAAALPAAYGQGTTVEWQGQIQPGQTFEIRNINGDIRAEAASGPQLEILVNITGTRPDPRTIRIDIVPHTGGILACTIYEGLSSPGYCTPDLTPSITLNDSDISVQYTVRIPAGVGFTGRTVNGNIDANLPRSEVLAESVNGRIVLSTSMPAAARVVNGSIIATLGAIDWDGVREFQTVNGTIDLAVPESAHADVQASNVWGLITTDFPIHIHRGIVGSWLDGTINGGGPKLAMSTVNGSIHLRRTVVDAPVQGIVTRGAAPWLGRGDRGR